MTCTPRQIGGQRRDQRLALTGLHLGDLASVQHDPADELNVEVAHREDPPAGLANRRKCIGQQIVQRFSPIDPLAKGGGLAPELGVGQSTYGFLARVDGVHQWLYALQVACVLRAEDLGQKGVEHQ